MEEELGNEEQEETYNFDSETEQSMEESENELFEVTDEENELRPSSHIRRIQERHEEKQHRFLRIIR